MSTKSKIIKLIDVLQLIFEIIDSNALSKRIVIKSHFSDFMQFSLQLVSAVLQWYIANWTFRNWSTELSRKIFQFISKKNLWFEVLKNFEIFVFITIRLSFPKSISYNLTVYNDKTCNTSYLNNTKSEQPFLLIIVISKPKCSKSFFFRYWLVKPSVSMHSRCINDDNSDINMASPSWHVM